MPTLRVIAIVSLALVASIRAAAAQELARELRYVTLQNGTAWEGEISDRATTASWEAGDFVGIRRIWAPRNGYDWLLTKSENAEHGRSSKGRP
jgi:hypothetical protein